jgi:GT2 family glycosyltransferase
MITIIYSTHKDLEFNNKFKQHLLQTVGLKDVQILEYINHNEHSLSELYNKGISESINNIVVCCHNDIKLEKNWGKKLLEDFSNNPEFGIIGKAGSCYFPESGVYWERMNLTMVGQVYHHPENQKKWLSQYSPKLPFLIPVVTIDGLFISFDKTKIKHTFDESYGKFHFYDHGFSFPNYLDGVKVGVTSSFEITHQSVGQPNQEFWLSKEKFVEKWGGNLPSDLLPKRIYVPEIKEKPIKNIGKVAVIIPTKGKTNLLIQCLDSFIEHSNTQYYHIFVADTGSKEEEISEIQNYISKNSTRISITLIEYDYYNFAKINNDVVKNHIGNEYEYLLFCNNDIKLLNNVIYGMLKIMKEHPRTGTVGCRLHFEDNTVQHGGVFAGLNSQGQFMLGHNNLKSYYNYPTSFKKVFGNTGALMMIRKNVFEKCGGFNEKYTTCFEDVELNAKCLLMGYENYFDGSLVSYHFESQTRGKDETNSKGESLDYSQTFMPFISQNITKLRNHIVNVN